MANVRCPMCSKINTPEAEKCVYCGAHLKVSPPQPAPATGEPAPEEPVGNSSEDWLSSLRLGNETDPSPEKNKTPNQLSPEDSSAPNTPDWLSRIRERARVETGDPSRQPEADSEDPDWMKGLRSEPDLPDPAESSGDLLSRLPETPAPDSEAAEQEELLPDAAESIPALEGEEEWVNKLSAWQAGKEDVPSAVEDLPDWLSSEAEPVENLTGDLIPMKEPADIPAQDGLPDWYAGFDAAGTQVEHEAGQPAPVETTASEIPEGELPDWLGEESQLDASAAEAVSPEPAPSLPFSPEESPEWLRDFATQAPTGSDTVLPLIDMDDLELNPVGGKADEAFSSGDLPDWLSEESSLPGSDREPENVSEPAGEELAHADLPEWVKEMRPIESVLPAEMVSAESSQQVEKAGPLAGLRGILPAEDLSARYRKPPVYSAKLRVSEKQHSQSSLLDSIVAQESQALLIAHARSRAPRVFARIVIALLFLAVLAAVRIFPLGWEPASLLAPPELDDMFNQIEKTDAQNAPVLLAVDYEPGRFAEMYFASSPVIEHLMAKNAHIVVLSTVPTGPALAQRLLEDAARDLEEKTDQSYDPTTQSLNLGYLPGGTISLLEFAHLPSRAAPATLEGNFDIWNQPFLQNVKDMSGFSQVIVLTDSAETGRAWVEQVQPLMGKTPLFMVTSAQAAPLLMPYVQSQQINGMVSGLLGGVIYGQWRHVDTAASVYWESYQVGILLAVGIILFGGLFSAAMAFIKRKDKEEE